MAKETIIILDSESEKVFIYPYDSAMWEDAEDFLVSEEIDLRPSNCQWMVVEKLVMEVTAP